MCVDAYRSWRTSDGLAKTGFAISNCVLVKAGKACCYMMVDENDQAGLEASEKFCEAVYGMTGCRLSNKSFDGGVPIRIGKSAVELLGNPHFTDECFLLCVNRDGVLAYGNDDDPFCGTDYAVTALLEALGFGFFGPDDLWNVCPKNNEAVLPGVNMRSKPHFNCRRTRVLEQQPKLAKQWGLGGIRSEVEHKYGSFFPPAKYEKDHPEYYALSHGTRSLKGKKWWELCLSNPEVQRKMADDVCDFFEHHPEWVGLSIGQNDGSGEYDSIDYANWCECEQCRAFAPTFSDAVLRFSNLVAMRVYEKYPEHTLMFYGYFGTYPAPTVACPEPISPNLQLTLCKECGFTGKIRTNESCTDAAHPPFSENFAKWKSTGLKHIAIYEWGCPGAANPAWKEAFWVQGEVEMDNLRWFYENGVDFVYFDQGPNESYERIKDVFILRWPQWYSTSRAMYNTNLTFEEIMRPACEKLYGSAANEMYEFYLALSAANCHSRVPHFNWGLPLVREIYEASYLDKCESALQKAEKCLALTVDQIERICQQREEWQHTKEMIKLQ